MRISDWSSDVCSSDLIDKGAAWARRRRGRDMLSEDFVRTLHKRMFGEVWAWAGSYRRTARNIGVDAYRIPAEVVQLLDDVSYWVEHHTYDPADAALRLHHRTVSIHPFPNGTGRPAPMMADLLIHQLGRRPHPWGGPNLADD